MKYDWQRHPLLASLLLIPLILAIVWFLAAFNGTAINLRLAQVALAGLCATSYYRIASHQSLSDRPELSYSALIGLWFGLWLNICFMTPFDESFWARLLVGGALFAGVAHWIFTGAPDTADGEVYYTGQEARNAYAKRWPWIVLGAGFLCALLNLSGPWIALVMLSLLNVTPMLHRFTKASRLAFAHATVSVFAVIFVLSAAYFLSLTGL